MWLATSRRGTLMPLMQQRTPIGVEDSLAKELLASSDFDAGGGFRRSVGKTRSRLRSSLTLSRCRKSNSRSSSVVKRLCRSCSLSGPRLSTSSWKSLHIIWSCFVAPDSPLIPRARCTGSSEAKYRVSSPSCWVSVPSLTQPQSLADWCDQICRMAACNRDSTRSENARGSISRWAPWSCRAVYHWNCKNLAGASGIFRPSLQTHQKGPCCPQTAWVVFARELEPRNQSDPNSHEHVLLWRWADGHRSSSRRADVAAKL